MSKDGSWTRIAETAPLTREENEQRRMQEEQKRLEEARNNPDAMINNKEFKKDLDKLHKDEATRPFAEAVQYMGVKEESKGRPYHDNKTGDDFEITPAALRMAAKLNEQIREINNSTHGHSADNKRRNGDLMMSYVNAADPDALQGAIKIFYHLLGDDKHQYAGERIGFLTEAKRQQEELVGKQQDTWVERTAPQNGKSGAKTM